MARHMTQGTMLHTEGHVGRGRQGRRLASATFPINCPQPTRGDFLVSICFLPYVHDHVRDIWMVLPAGRADRDSFELSVSNANGADLLCTLGLAPEPCGEPVPIEHFAGLVTEAARRHLDHRSPHSRPSRMFRKDGWQSSSSVAPKVTSKAGWVT